MNDNGELAALKVKVEHLEDKVDEMSGDLKIVLSALAEIRGGKKLLWIIWSVLGGLVGMVGTYFAVRG